MQVRAGISALEADWLSKYSLELAAIQVEQFFDERDGGWFSTTGRDPSVLLRLKEDYDGAEPSAASVTVRNLLVLGNLTGEAAYVDRARQSLERYGTQIGRVVRVMPFMVTNVVYWHARKLQVVFVGPRHSVGTLALERVAAQRYLPFAVTVPVEPGAASQTLSTRLPWVGAMTEREGRPSAYVCDDFACQAPVTDAAALEQQLTDVSGSAPRRIVQL